MYSEIIKFLGGQFLWTVRILLIHGGASVFCLSRKSKSLNIFISSGMYIRGLGLPAKTTKVKPSRILMISQYSNFKTVIWICSLPNISLCPTVILYLKILSLIWRTICWLFNLLNLFDRKDLNKTLLYFYFKQPHDIL